MIYASVYLLVFIQNLLVHLAEKILLMQPLTFREDYRVAVKATEDLLLDQRRRGCRILGKPRSQSLCDTRAELRSIGDNLGTTQLQFSGCRERQECWRLVD